MRRPEDGRGDAGPGLSALALVGLALVGLAGCEVPQAINPVFIYREVTGLSDEGRRPPPGLDEPFPNLASVPPRPARPTQASQDAISAALAADRSDARDPLVLRSVTGAGGPASPPGSGDPAARPPPRASLAAAPRVPWTEAPAGGRAEPASGVRPGAGPAAPLRPEPTAPEMPDRAPPGPPPELLGAPPPPPADLLAPRPR